MPGPDWSLKANARKSRRQVGFYGCGRVVRVSLRSGVQRAPKSAKVECPACGLEHLVAIAWRTATERDEGREPELVVGQPPTSEPEIEDALESHAA
jgi:hypothetical protein